ncbi:MAG: SprB repeat-containing protein, partial [Bacteroidetes bacterium]|nr:SprB repeat-containing protein [Bacteroidota bacterium]
QTVCASGTIPNLTASGTGTLKWYSDATLTTLVYTGTSYATGKTAAGIYTYYVTNNNNSCVSSSIAITLQIDAVTNAGTLGNTQAICLGQTAAALNLTGSVGSIEKWQSSINSGGSWSDIANTTTTLSPGALTQTTQYQVFVKNGFCSELTSNIITVTVNPLPNTTIDPVSNKCQNDAAVTLVGSPTGAGGAFTGTGVSGNQFNPATAGPGTWTVTYTYTDGNTCVKSASTDITVLANPNVYTVGGSGTYCFGTAGRSVTLTGSQTGVNYQLYKNTASFGAVKAGDGNPLTWINMTSGTYTVRATNAVNVCDALMTGSAVITEDPAISAGITPNPAYALTGTPYQLNGNPVGGTAAYSTHAWTGAGSSSLSSTSIVNPVFTNATAGNYALTYTVTDSHGCTASSTISVNVTTAPVAPTMSDQTRCGTGTILMAATIGANGDQVQFSLDGSTVDATDGSSPYEYTTPSITAGSFITVFARTRNSTTGYFSAWMSKTATAYLLTVGGTATPVAAIICNNSSTTINLTGQTGVVTGWERQVGAGSWAGIGNAGSTSISTGALTPPETYNFRALVQSQNCTPQYSSTATVTVTQMSLQTSLTHVLCNGGSNGAIVLTVTGGTGPFGYLWSNGASTKDISTLIAGTYSVTVTDATFCTVTGSWTITQPTTLTTTAVVSDVLIPLTNGGAINVTVTNGTSPYSYIWGDGPTTEDRTSLYAGTYYLTVTDHNGCQNFKTYVVHEPAQYNVTSVINPVSCNSGSNGAVNLTVAGGTTPYTFHWSTGAPTEDISGLAASTYYVTITDIHSYVYTNSYVVTQPTVFSLAPAVTNVSCYNGNNASIYLNVSGATPPYTYLWSNGATSADLVGITQGSYAVTITDHNLCTHTAGWSITQPTPLTVTVIVENVSVPGFSDGNIDITPGGGTTPYTYAWSNGATSQDLVNVIAGFYTVTVTDFKGCQIIKNYFVSEPGLFELTSDITDVSCPLGTDGAIDVSVSGGTPPYTYLWSNGETTEDLSGIGGGNYQVIITDVADYSTYGSFTVYEPPVFHFTAVKQNVSCNGYNDGSLDISLSGGTPPYNYLWSNGSGNQDIYNLYAGPYTVNVTDNHNCPASDTWTVTQPVTLGVTAVITQVSCNGGNDGTIKLSIVGGTTPYNYLWSIGSTSKNQFGLAAGPYSVTVTDAHGCSTTGTWTITEPAVLTLSGIPVDVLCNGGFDGDINITVTGGTPPYHYYWSNQSTNKNLTNVSAGTYYVVVVDSKNCQISDHWTINEPDELSVTSVISHVSCKNGNDGSILLTVTGGTQLYSYSWNTGATTKDLINIGSGTYTVTVTDANNCTTTETYTVTQPSALVLSGIAIPVRCNGGNTGSITTNVGGGSPPYTFLWSNGATTQNLTGVAAGTYSLVATDHNGCTKTGIWTVSEPLLLTLSAEVTQVSCFGGNDGAIDLTISGGTAPYVYYWSVPSTSQDLTNLTSGTYSVLVVDARGCTATGIWIVSQPLALSGTAVVTNATCMSSGNGAINLTMFGGTQPYSYQWSNGATTQDIDGLTADTYHVVVTDAHFCAWAGQWTITQPASTISASAVITDVSCYGGSTGSIVQTVSGGTPPYTYLWQNGATTKDLTGIPMGSYAVTIYDHNFCSINKIYIVTQPDALSLSGGTTPVSCFNGNDGTVSISISGGATPYSYAWSNGATTENLTGVTAGTYTVTVTDHNGCTISDHWSVVQPNGLVLTGVATNVSCFGGNNGTVNITVIGGTTPYTFNWSNNTHLEDLAAVSAGTLTTKVVMSMTATRFLNPQQL